MRRSTARAISCKTRSLRRRRRTAPEICVSSPHASISSSWRSINASTDVQVDFLRSPERQWVLTAERGFVPEDSRVVQFRGDVHLRPADRQYRTLSADERIVDRYGKERRLHTHSPVDLRFGRLVHEREEFRGRPEDGKSQARIHAGSFESES